MEEKRFKLFYGKGFSKDAKTVLFETKEDVDGFLKTLSVGVTCSIVDFEEKTVEFFINLED